MAEVLKTFAELVTSEEGLVYAARACGRPTGHLWEGWVEFVPENGGTAVRSGRETTQPNRRDVAYWAAGLTPVFMQGALRRALQPVSRPVATPEPPPAYDGPAPPFVDRDQPDPVAGSGPNPLSVYRKGEALLRKQLAALSAWHLVNILRDYELSSESPEELNRKSERELIDLIVVAARARIESLANR